MTTNSSCSSNNNVIQHVHNTPNQQQIHQSQSQRVVVPMESGNDDNFTIVS
ncbi:unnamed protein product, partial [Rotaria sordida]